MKKKSRVILLSIACILLVLGIAFCIIGIILNDDPILKKVRAGFNNINLTNYSGYNQTITISKSAFTYTAYEKSVQYNGTDIRLYTKQNTLNELGQGEAVTSKETTSYVTDGQLIELVNGQYKATQQAVVKFSFAYSFRKVNLASFALKNNVFTANVRKDKIKSFSKLDPDGIVSMAISVELNEGKVESFKLTYKQEDGSTVVITTVMETALFEFVVPSYS